MIIGLAFVVLSSLNTQLPPGQTQGPVADQQGRQVLDYDKFVAKISEFLVGVKDPCEEVEVRIYWNPGKNSGLILLKCLNKNWSSGFYQVSPQSNYKLTPINHVRNVSGFEKSYLGDSYVFYGSIPYVKSIN